MKHKEQCSFLFSPPPFSGHLLGGKPDVVRTLKQPTNSPCGEELRTPASSQRGPVWTACRGTILEADPPKPSEDWVPTS